MSGARRRRMGRQLRAGAIARHPLAEALAGELLPNLCQHSAIDRHAHALGIANLICEAYERRTPPLYRMVR